MRIVIAFLCCCTAAAAAGGSSGSSASAQPANLTGTIRLFVDPRLVDEASGFTPTVGPVTKDAQNPLLVEDRLYDVRWDNTYM